MNQILSEYIMNKHFIGKGLRAMIISIGLSAICSAAFGKPATPRPLTVTQPDGSELTIRLVGDEFGHLYLTDDNCALTHDNELGYVYANIAEDGTLVSSRIMAHDSSMRGASENAVASRLDNTSVSKFLSSRKKARRTLDDVSELGPERAKVAEHGYGLCDSSFPSKGEQKGLVILVEFQDVKFNTMNSAKYKYEKYASTENPAHTYWSDMLNKEGFDAFGSMGSCRDWYISNSTDSEGNPQFIPEFDLYGPVTLPENMSYYGGNNYWGDDKNPDVMVVQACQLLDNEIDFSQYDRDGDGNVDNVYIFYAGFGEADYGGDDTIWPHSYDLRYTGKAFNLDGVRIDHYACSNEVDHYSKTPDSIGTFVHEFSHVMGLPDLYCTDESNAYTPGAYSVLDYGPYNNDGRTPPNYSAYERWALGWLHPIKYEASGEITLQNLADTNTAYLVETEKDTEYYLVENRQQSGWDTYIPGHGMLIWHVDYVPHIFEYNQVNNTPNHQYVDLVEANGRSSSRYSAGHPFPGSNNVTSYEFKSWSGYDLGVRFDDIKENADGSVTKNATVKPAGIDDIHVAGNGEARYYNLQGIPVDGPTRGMYIRVVDGKATVRTSE